MRSGIEPLLCVSDLRVHRGAASVGPINLALNRGSVVAILGRSGSGKSTIVEALAGLLPCTSSAWAYCEASRLPRVAWKPGEVGALLQESGLFAALTVKGNVEVVRSDCRAPIQSGECLQIVGYHGDASASVTSLSGGEMRRVAMARTLATGAPVLMFDEPSAGLDPGSATAVARAVSAHVAARKGALLVTGHSLQSVIDFAPDQILVIDHGCVEAEGTQASLMAGAKTRAVAEALGYNVFLDAEAVEPGRFMTASGTLEVPNSKRHEPGQRCVLAFPKGAVRARTDSLHQGVVVRILNDVPRTYALVRLEDGTVLPVVLEAGMRCPGPGDRLGIALLEAEVLMDA